MDQGIQLEHKDKQSCYSCMQHSALTCSIILPRIIEILQAVAVLSSGNEHEVNIWIRKHNKRTKISRVVILVCDT